MEADTLMSHTVLVVEDEPGVRDLVGEVLRRNGYDVLKAESGREAIRIAGERDGRIQLVLTDMVMPDVTGTELAEQLQSSQPDVKILLMSGYSEELLGNRGEMRPGTVLLEKPFTTSLLLQKVDQALQPAAE